jgi:hypothetical protein
VALTMPEPPSLFKICFAKHRAYRGRPGLLYARNPATAQLLQHTSSGLQLHLQIRCVNLLAPYMHGSRSDCSGAGRNGVELFRFLTRPHPAAWQSGKNRAIASFFSLLFHQADICSYYKSKLGLAKLNSCCIAISKTLYHKRFCSIIRTIVR